MSERSSTSINNLKSLSNYESCSTVTQNKVLVVKPNELKVPRKQKKINMYS